MLLLLIHLKKVKSPFAVIVCHDNFVYACWKGTGLKLSTIAEAGITTGQPDTKNTNILVFFCPAFKFFFTKAKPTFALTFYSHPLKPGAMAQTSYPVCFYNH